MQVSPLRRERKMRGWSPRTGSRGAVQGRRRARPGTLAVDGTTLGRYERGTIHFPREPVPEAMSILYGKPVHGLWPEQAWQELTQDVT